jgi:hypothetical protein
MNEQDVTTSIKTPEVLLAFEGARLDKLPGEVRERYVAQDLECDRYSDHTAMLVNEGRREGVSEGRRESVSEGREEGRREVVFEIARKMLIREEIVDFSGITKEVVETMKTVASYEDL